MTYKSTSFCSFAGGAKDELEVPPVEQHGPPFSYTEW